MKTKGTKTNDKVFKTVLQEIIVEVFRFCEKNNNEHSMLSDMKITLFNIQLNSE